MPLKYMYISSMHASKESTCNIMFKIGKIFFNEINKISLFVFFLNFIIWKVANSKPPQST